MNYGQIPRELPLEETAPQASRVIHAMSNMLEYAEQLQQKRGDQQSAALAAVAENGQKGKSSGVVEWVTIITLVLVVLILIGMVVYRMTDSARMRVMLSGIQGELKALTINVRAVLAQRATASLDTVHDTLLQPLAAAVGPS